MTQLHPNYPIGGCDVSYWQAGIDFDTLLDRDIWFIICRASVGTQADTRYQSHKLGAIGHGLPVGCYHYWMPRYSVDGNCAALIQAQPTRPPMGVWLDLEGKGFTITKRALSEHIYQCIQRLDEHYGVMTGLYTRATWWDYWIDSDYYDLIDAPSRPLWVAQYFYEFHPAPTAIPQSWPGAHIWQYSAEQGPYAGQASEFGVTGTASLDIDAWLGTEQEFKQFTGVSLPPVEIPMQVKTKTVCNIRNNPDLTAGSDVGNLEAGKVLNVIAEIAEFYKVETYVAKSVVEPVIIPPPPTITGWKVLGDLQKGKVRSAAPCPEVYWISLNTIELDEPKQRLIWDMNQPYMSAAYHKTIGLVADYEKWYRQNLGTKTAWANETGFDDPDGPRADYIDGWDLSARNPRLSKCYVGSGAVLHGTENNGILTVEVIDATKPCPTWEEIEDKYWLWFWAKIVQLDGKTIPFPYCAGHDLRMPIFGIPPVTVALNKNIPDKPIPYIVRI